MTRPPNPKFVVHCVLSNVSIGYAEDGRIFDTSIPGTLRTTLHCLIDGDHLTLQMRVPDHRRPVNVKLARVSWIQGGRFGVELLMMDTDERARLSRFLDDRVPLELEFQDSRAELIITAAEG